MPKGSVQIDDRFQTRMIKMIPNVPPFLMQHLFEILVKRCPLRIGQVTPGFLVSLIRLLQACQIGWTALLGYPGLRYVCSFDRTSSIRRLFLVHLLLLFCSRFWHGAHTQRSHIKVANHLTWSTWPQQPESTLYIFRRRFCGPRGRWWYRGRRRWFDRRGCRLRRGLW